MSVETYHNGVIKESLEIPPDYPVFVVVQSHDYEGAFDIERELGDLMMPEVYAFQRDAQKHWRLTSSWIPKPERTAARVEQTIYGEWMRRVGMSKDGSINMANPFDGLHYGELKINYALKWGKEWKLL